MRLFRCLIILGLVCAPSLYAQSENYEDDVPFGFWLMPTLRGMQSDVGTGNAHFGLAGGLAIPWRFGIDIGVGLGEMFHEGGTLVYDYRARIYMTDVYSGVFAGGGWLTTDQDEKQGQGYFTLGYAAKHLYGEIDFAKKDHITPITAIPEFGWRWQF